MIRLGGATPKYYAFLCKSWEDKFSVINIFALFLLQFKNSNCGEGAEYSNWYIS